MKHVISNYFREKRRQAYFELALYLFTAALPIGHGIDAILAVPLLLTWWFSSTWNDKTVQLKKHRISLFLVYGLHLLFWIGLLYSEETKVAFGRIERSLALLVLPLIIFSANTAYLNLKRIFYALGAGLLVVMLVSWADIFLDILSKPVPLKQVKYFFEWIYTDDNLLMAMDIHPGYFVLFLVLFLSAFINNTIFNSFRSKKGRYVIALLLFTIFLVETSSRIGFLCSILILLIDATRKATPRRRWLQLSVVVILILISTQFDYLYSKFDKLIDGQGNITFERYHRWKAILKVFVEGNNWLFGVGSGDVYQVYREAYAQGGFSLALKENYNAHNQYLELLVGNGLIGLAWFIGVLTHFSIRTRLKEMALAFIILIVIFSFSESFLIRSKGVFFFAFFYSMLLKKYVVENED